MGFKRVKDIVDDAYRDGKFCYSTIRKVPSIGSVAGNWVDLSMSPGNPRANYYSTTELTSATKNCEHGIFHGSAGFTEDKYLHKLSLMSTTAGAAPATYILCDYLLYYPLIDMDSSEEQFFYNTVTLPRYTDGEGVKAFVVATNPYAGSQPFQISYTNQDGVSGRKSISQISNASIFISTIINSGPLTGVLTSPFLGLASGDRGIRSVQSITFYGPNGGLAALVLVRPIATMMTRETTAWSEWDFVKDKPSLPKIMDGAYLNFICCCSATVASAPINGEATFIWGS